MTLAWWWLSSGGSGTLRGMSEQGTETTPQGGAPGLDLYRQSSTNFSEEYPAPQGCVNPRRGVVMVNVETGEVRLVGCGSNTCPACCRINAWQRALAIAWAKPERAITLTLVARAEDEDPWQTSRRTVNRWREWIKRLGGDPGQTIVHVEPNPRETGYHAHLWQHGSRIDFALSDAAARRAGCGWVHVEAIRNGSGVGAYGLKGLAYGLKGVNAGQSEYLRVNGGRLTHQSRGFFRGLGVREAERQAGNDSGVSPWRVQWA